MTQNFASAQVQRKVQKVSVPINSYRAFLQVAQCSAAGERSRSLLVKCCVKISPLGTSEPLLLTTIFYFFPNIPAKCSAAMSNEYVADCRDKVVIGLIRQKQVHSLENVTGGGY